MGNEEVENALQNAMIDIAKGGMQFLENSNVAAVATLCTLLGFVAPLILCLFKSLKNARALVKQDDKEQVQRVIEIVCEIFMIIGAIYLYAILLEIHIYIIELTKIFKNNFAYALFLIALLTMVFILYTGREKNKSEKGYSWIACNIIFFECIFSFCVGGIIGDTYEKNVYYIYCFLMIVTAVYSLFILLRHERKGGWFLYKGNGITFFLACARNIVLVVYLNCIIIFQRFIDISIYILDMWVIITCINWVIKTGQMERKQEILVIVETDFGKLVSTNNVKETKRGQVFLSTKDNEQYYLNRESIISIKYDIYNKRPSGSLKTRFEYILKRRSGEKNEKRECNFNKCINQGWVKFEKYESAKTSVVLVPQERIQYIKCVNKE